MCRCLRRGRSRSAARTSPCDHSFATSRARFAMVAPQPSGGGTTVPRTTKATATQGAVSLDGLEWRQVGPFRGGRVEAVAGDPRDRNTFYFGSCGGGVWKTTDGGIYWRNVSDE